MLEQAIAKKEVVILDVNGSNSYASGHLPSAIDFHAVAKEEFHLPQPLRQPMEDRAVYQPNPA